MDLSCREDGCGAVWDGGVGWGGPWLWKANFRFLVGVRTEKHMLR